MSAHPDPVTAYVRKLNGRLWGIAFGVLLGFSLFLATNVLVLQGGEDVGQHLGLLCNYFPGYSVTFLGSLIGFAYAFFLGYVAGRVLCLIYNRFARNA